MAHSDTPAELPVGVDCACPPPFPINDASTIWLSPLWDWPVYTCAAMGELTQWHPTSRRTPVLLSLLGKLTINANESQSGDYLTSLTYRPRERASETMGHERHETKYRAQGRLGQLVTYWVGEGWEVRTQDVNKEDKWSFAKARSAPTPAHYGPPATGQPLIPSAAPPPMPKVVPAAPLVAAERPIVTPPAPVANEGFTQQLETLMREAMHCRECFARFGVEEPFITFAQPRWVGPRYSAAPCCVVVLMINPGESKDKPSARAYIPRANAFREGKIDFHAFMEPQRHDLSSWGNKGGHRNPEAFYVHGLGLELDEIALANVAWCGTKDNEYPRPMLRHCFERFTAPLLRLLNPSFVLVSGTGIHHFASQIRSIVPGVATVSMLHYGHRKGNDFTRAELTRVRQALTTARQAASKG